MLQGGGVEHLLPPPLYKHMVHDGMMQIIGKAKENLAHLAVLLVRTLIFLLNKDWLNRLLNQMDWLNQNLLLVEPKRNTEQKLVEPK